MSSVVVDGLVLPVAVGGHPALDFCNTLAGWGWPATREYLQSYDHLAVWAREAGLLGAAATAALCTSATERPRSAQAVLGKAVALREAAYPLAVGESSADQFAAVAVAAAAARAAATLRPAADIRSSHSSRSVARWVLPDGGLDAPLLAISGQLGDLLCSPLSRVVAACPGVGCGWLFADPRRRRRWCDMAVCGNRAKARRQADRARKPHIA